MEERYLEQIEALYFECYKKLETFAVCSLKNMSLAEEAVQETFRIACSKPESIAASPNPKGWLVNTLKYVISNIEKRQMVASKIISDYLGDEIDKLPAPVEQINLELLYGDVADSEEFKMIKAIALDGKSMIELAEELGITVAACKKRVQRAKKNLQKRMK